MPNVSSDENFLPLRVVSGGQTGVDRAGLEAAIANQLEHGGWCPRGRRSEDGSIPSRYELKEMDSPDYPARTEQNVIDSDATLILYENVMRGGTLLTKKFAKRWDRTLLCIDITKRPPDEARVWLEEHRPETLNVAGPRESSCPGIGQRAFEFLLEVFASHRQGGSAGGAR